MWPNLFPWNGNLFRSIFHQVRWSKLFGPPVSFNQHSSLSWASLVAQMVKNLPALQETWVQSLGQEDRLEKGMATHSSILAWRILWTEEPCWLQSVRLQRVRHSWAGIHTSLSADPAIPEATIWPLPGRLKPGGGDSVPDSTLPPGLKPAPVVHGDQRPASRPGYSEVDSRHSKARPHGREREIRSRVKQGGLERGWEGKLWITEVKGK